MSQTVFLQKQYGALQPHFPSCYPHNIYAVFIGPNPITSFNPYAYFRKLHPSSFTGPFSSIIGDVTVIENVFIAPDVCIRLALAFIQLDNFYTIR